MIRVPTALFPGSIALLLLLAAGAAAAAPAEAQGRGNRAREVRDVRVDGGATLSVEVAARIRGYYGSQPASGVEGLPPGIRKNLARGKPLPPGIAKKVAPPGLQSGLGLPAGYELVEVGVDVLLVEVATQIVHDVLMDVIR